MKKYIIFGGIAAALAFGGWYAYGQVKLVDNLYYDVVGYKIRNISKEGARVDLILQVRNDGLLNVEVEKFKFNIFVEGKFMATAASNSKMFIRPNQSETTEISILMNPKAMLKNVGTIFTETPTIISDWKKLGLTIDGSLKIKKGGIPFFIPIVLNFKLSDFTES